MENINKQLLELYSSKWNELRGAILSFNDLDEIGNEYENPEDFATNPLLIKLHDNLTCKKRKIMFFGQETNTWYGEFGEQSNIDKIIQGYEKFYLKKGFEKYRSPIWHYIKSLQMRFPDVEFIWNNILKIGKMSSGTPQEGLINETKKHFNVIRSEIEIVQPELMLFFTGPQYDTYIREFIGEYHTQEVLGFKKNELCELIFVNNSCIKRAFRTYHPAYLNRIRKKRKQESKKDIKTQINIIIFKQYRCSLIFGCAVIWRSVFVFL